jgi:predicted Zn-dependent peptidase
MAAALVVQRASAQTIDRTHPPKAGPAPVLTIKDPVKYKLPNGMTILVVEDHRLPKISASLLIDAGPQKEGAKAGEITLMGSMLNEGTKTMPKAVFDEAVEKIGADVGLNSAGGSASALTRYFPRAFELMGQALKQPAFTQESFDKLKTQTITNIRSEANSAPAIAGRVVNALAYGKNHPDGEFETEESVNKLTLADIKAVYAKYITPSRSYLTFVGDIKPSDAKALAVKVFGAWKGAPLTLPVLPPVANLNKTEVDMVDVPSAVQAEIHVLNLVNLRKNDPDYFAALLANYILGGNADSRLFMNLRETKKFTYGAYSSLGSGRFQTLFDASASVRNEKADSAVMEFVKEIHRIRTEKVTDDELRIAKALYNGSFALGLEDPARTATFASNILINNLPPDFYKTYLQKVNAVTTDDILRVAKKYMSNDPRVVIAGNAAKIEGALKKDGFTVKNFDAFADPVKAGQTVNVNAKDIIKGYIAAIGGADELSKVKSIHATMNLAVQGMSLSVDQKKMAPNKDLMSMSMGGNVMMKSVFDGEKGYQIQGGVKKDLDATQIAEKKVFTSLTEQLDYLNNPAFKLTVKGIQKVNGSDAYQVVVVSPSGKSSTEYYDVLSKLLVKNETSATTDGNTVMQTLELSDYRKVGNVLMPYKEALTISASGQNQNLVMTVTDIKINSGVSEADFK